MTWHNGIDNNLYEGDTLSDIQVAGCITLLLPGRWRHNQHFGRADNSHREVLGFCAQEVDKAVSVLVQRVKSRLLATVDKMELQLRALENDMR